MATLKTLKEAFDFVSLRVSQRIFNERMFVLSQRYSGKLFNLIAKMVHFDEQARGSL
jgi:hypothetical protein